MGNSELPTRVSASARSVRRAGALLDAPRGRPVVVVAIDNSGRALLEPEGIDVGVELCVERRLALGGPLIVRLGRARLAMARSVAAGVTVEPAVESGSRR